MSQDQSKPALVPGTENEIKSALLAGTAIAKPQANPHPESRAYAMVPDGHKIEYLDREDFPTRRRGTVELDDADSFLEYWKRQAIADGSYIYGSMQPAQFVAVLNEHSKDQADWRDHRAVLTLKHSQEWLTWAGRDRKAFDGNEAFALWLEDNLPDIIKPEPAQFMDIALNFRVQQGQFYGKSVRLQDGNVKLDYTNNVEASGGPSTVAASMSIPESFTIRVPVFQGLDAKMYEVEARFRFKLQSGALSIRYELVRAHKVIEQAFKECLEEIQTAAATRVLFGRP